MENVVAKKEMTIREFAEAAGITYSMASQYNRGIEKASLSKETYYRIDTLAKEIGYVPSRRYSGYFVNKEECMKYRELGYSNGEIADIIGCSSSSVLSHIGPQPLEITLRVNRNRSKLSKMNREERKAYAEKVKAAKLAEEERIRAEQKAEEERLLAEKEAEEARARELEAFKESASMAAANVVSLKKIEEPSEAKPVHNESIANLEMQIRCTMLLLNTALEQLSKLRYVDAEKIA